MTMIIDPLGILLHDFMWEDFAFICALLSPLVELNIYKTTLCLFILYLCMRCRYNFFLKHEPDFLKYYSCIQG